MFSRLLALSVVLMFSFSPLAQTPGQPNHLLKIMVDCDEVSAAKHISLMVPLALVSALDPKIASDLEVYELAIRDAKTCEDISKAYIVLTEITKKHGTDPEVYFASPEGKSALEELVTELRKLKN